MANSQPVIVGRIGKTYGIKGWLKIHSHTEPAANLFTYSPWQVHQRGKWLPIEIAAHKAHGNGFVVKFADIDTPEAAQAWVNCDIAVSRDALPDLSDEDYYWQDLVGLSVITVDGQTLGKVDHLLATGANDVLVIKGEKDYLVPYIWDRVVQHVDLAAQQIQVDWDVDY